MAVATLPDGLEIFHRVHGAGEPLLLIAGAISDHTLWGAQVVAYRSRFRTIVFDQRGTGRSGHPADVASYTTAAMADDAAALLWAIGVESAHVSGFSLGSAVAQELALRHPERVRSLQLHGTWGRTDARLLRRLDALEEIAIRGDWGSFSREALRDCLSPAFLAESPDVAARLERAQILGNPHPPSRVGVLGHLHAGRTHDALDRLGGIRCPTLVTAGEGDARVPLHHGEEVARRIPGATFHIFRGPRASHLALLEMAEEFNRTTLLRL